MAATGSSSASRSHSRLEVSGTLVSSSSSGGMGSSPETGNLRLVDSGSRDRRSPGLNEDKIRSLEGGSSPSGKTGRRQKRIQVVSDGTDANNWSRPRSSTWSMPKAFDDALDTVSGLFVTSQDSREPKQLRSPQNHSDEEATSKVVLTKPKKDSKKRQSSIGAAEPSDATSTADRKASKEQALLNSLLFTLTPVVEGVVYLKKIHMPSKRRWGILDSTSLYIFKGPRDPRDPLVIPLIGACVRPVPFKQTTFQILASSGTYVLSVETQKELYVWVSKMTEICDHLVMVSIDSTPVELSAEFDGLTDAELAKQAVIDLQRSSEANQRCADCGREDPEWVSTNLGVYICIDCSGTHRRLGTHISKVRSIRLDKWLPEHISRLQEIGNKVANELWEYNVPEGLKPTLTTNSDEREQFIRMKYQEGRFRKDAELYAASQRSVSLTGDGLKTAILNLLRADDDFRNEVRSLLGLPNADPRRPPPSLCSSENSIPVPHDLPRISPRNSNRRRSSRRHSDHSPDRKTIDSTPESFIPPTPDPPA
ncbi:MAG: hypothetical protein Q8P67_29215 [archaeon]|nr:hypothetical protein [archaeon]